MDVVSANISTILGFRFCDVFAFNTDGFPVSMGLVLRFNFFSCLYIGVMFPVLRVFVALLDCGSWCQYFSHIGCAGFLYPKRVVEHLV